jgi:DNA modification methylase
MEEKIKKEAEKKLKNLEKEIDDLTKDSWENVLRLKEIIDKDLKDLIGKLTGGEKKHLDKLPLKLIKRCEDLYNKVIDQIFFKLIHLKEKGI